MSNLPSSYDFSRWSQGLTGGHVRSLFAAAYLAFFLFAVYNSNRPF